jgi:phage shock protein A
VSSLWLHSWAPRAKIMGFFRKIDLSELQERVDKLETSNRELKLEWLSTYDKFRSILARIAKREERARLQPESDSSAGFQEAEPASSASSLDPISARIHARRSRLGLRGPTQ